MRKYSGEDFEFPIVITYFVKTPTLTLSPTATTVLKALAIASVVTIHIFSSLKISPFVGGSSNQWWAVAFDRFNRLSVPLFVALSGYGLSRKYSRQPFAWREFVKNRLWRLLPPYFLWCGFYIFFVWLYYDYSLVSNFTDLGLKLILGRIDYHLYFVPMIFQLYLLFPLVFGLWQKFPKLTLLLALTAQLAWIWTFSYHPNSPFNLSYFQNDPEQYFWSINWLWYFVLGFHLPNLINWLERSQLLRRLIVPSFLLTWVGTSYWSILQINRGLDPLLALRFTQYPVLLYATLGIAAASWSIARGKFLPAPLIWLGKYSYQVYLSHTLWIRLVFQLLIK